MRFASRQKLQRILTLTEALLDDCVYRPGGVPLGTQECRICGARWIATEYHRDGCSYAALEEECE